MKIEQLINYWSIGWSANNTANRNIGWQSLINGGWESFVEVEAKPVIAKGFKRLELHNPFGCMPNIDMESSQWIQARRSALYFLTEKFEKAWSPIVKQGIEVIAYMGTPSLDPMMKDLRAKGFNDLYLSALQKSYEVPISAGCSIAFDAMSEAGDQSPDYHFMRMLQKLGIKTYIEAWPAKDSPGLADCNEFTSSAFHPEVMRALKAGEWPMPVEKMTGERIQILSNEPYLSEGLSWANQFKWVPRWFQETSQFGETPCFNACPEFMNSKMTIEQWLGPLS